MGIGGNRRKQMVAKCDCISEFQDKLYGKQMRVFNPGKISVGSQLFRCTKCGREKNLNIKETREEK